MAARRAVPDRRRAPRLPRTCLETWLETWLPACLACTLVLGAAPGRAQQVAGKPTSLQQHNDQGSAYVTQQQFALAESEFRTVLRADPANNEANYNLGVLLLAKGAGMEAIPHLERVRPATTESTINLVRAYLQSKRNQDALRLAASLSAQHENDVKVHFSLGVLLASASHYKPAEVELEKADGLAPGTFEILYNLGQACFRDHAYAQADLALSRALKAKPDSPDALALRAQALAAQSRPMDALALLVQAHKLVPDDTNVILLMARISMSQHYFEDAIPLLESGMAIAPQRVDLHAALGESYLMAEQNDKAITELEKVIAASPSARDYGLLGLALERLGRFGEAKQAYSDGLKLDPHDISCTFHLGFIAERQGDASTAQARFLEILRAHPDDPGALLELANLRIASKNFPGAAELLRKYVETSQNPATGYYKLAMVERSLHDKAAEGRDLALFQAYSRKTHSGAYPNEHLFEYLDHRASLAPGARNESDIADLTDQLKSHPDQPEGLYLLAEAYLRAGDLDKARITIAHLDTVSAGDYRALAGAGVLLARYHRYEEAIQHFEDALKVKPDSDEVHFDLADALFRKGSYSEALQATGQISPAGRKDDACLALLGDIYAHMGNTTRATEILRDAILRNPDDDQNYLSLALLKLRDHDLSAARQVLLEGQTRIPGSGKILWGLGLTSALEDDPAAAGAQLERAVDLLPEWPGSYSALGVFYYQTGQIGKAKEVLSRFRNTGEQGALDINRIESALEQAPDTSSTAIQPMTMASKQQLLQLAITLADRTL